MERDMGGENPNTTLYRLKLIEQKLDKIETIVTQTSLQEYRITQLERALTRSHSRIWNIVSICCGALVSAAIAWIVSGGLSR